VEIENDDVVAALTWVAKQPFADAKRIAVAGCSFGGIHTLIAAARKTPARAAVDFAGGSMTWATWEPIRDRMKLAAREAKVPVFFLQAENDFDTTPSKALAEEMKNAGKVHEMRIYRPFGKTQMAGHGGFCLRGMPKWGDDVLLFLDRSFAAK
jgi:dienelactone hydrolase